ncbi:MAG: MFS transporter [Gammaproteobacteria bacterium]|nr:MAG: MFS transporter [Gammaproteobacteria bacterium]
MAGHLDLLEMSDPKIRMLHFTWIAFFICFFVWFNHAPLLASMREALGLSDQEIKALLILNVALTIPARIVIGMLVDLYGPRRVFSTLLVAGGGLCLPFAFADDYTTLALTRFLLGFIGAGFVIGIRMIGEWFPARQVGLAEGIYGGWGNFGSAAAAMTLPAVALWFGGENGWRWAIAASGVLAIVYGLFYFLVARDTPKGSTYFKPKRNGAMEVSSPGDFVLYLLMNLPLYAALGVLTWKLSPSQLGLLGTTAVWLIALGLTALLAAQVLRAWQVNREIFRRPVPEHDRYAFSQVAVLNVAYFVTFGSELAVVSMLPLFFLDTFAGLSQVQAGLLASGFAFMNLLARPSGGLISDRIGRRLSLIVLLIGLGFGYLLMSHIDAGWPLWAAVAATMLCSFFVQAGEGAVFAVVPLVKRRLTGQIAGMTGAYGNVGAVIYLTTLSFVDASTFFLVIAASALVALFLVIVLLREPRGHTAEVLPDGTVQMIEVG